MIFALATIPPVMAALECIDSGNETYVIIERGKTYNGIAALEKFHNVGFDPNDNLSQGFTATEFDAMVEQVKSLNAGTENAFFRFFVQDGTALKAAAIAANAGLAKDQFNVTMYEDGTGTYDALFNAYIKGKTVSSDKDEIYEAYAAEVEKVQSYFNTIMSKTDNKNSDQVLNYNIGRAFALAALPNFTLVMQNENEVKGILEDASDIPTKLLACFGFDGYDGEAEYSLKIEYKSISGLVGQLSEGERTDYLTLMYGDFYEDTFKALTRTERGGEAAPEKKLVFIGSRHSGYPKFASSDSYGIGGLKSGETLPSSYEALPEKYKTPLLFECKEDYDAFLAVVNNEANFDDGIDVAVKEAAKIACFNYYIDYIFTLKLTYALYGSDYDIIMKGHPREAIGSYSEWGNRYKVSYGEDKTYVYDKLMDAALLGFHSSDTVGKLIGTVPYGTSAENLAYLGVEIAIAGLPSSTYSGYELSVDVLFILAETEQDIAGTGSDNPASQVKARYDEGNLLYTDKDGNKQTTVFLNTGNVFKSIADVFGAQGNTKVSEKYNGLFNGWLTKNHPGATGIDAQGFAVK